MTNNNIKVEKTIGMIRNDYQRDRKQNTLSFYHRKRECIKMFAFYSESAAKVAPFNENSNV